MSSDLRAIVIGFKKKDKFFCVINEVIEKSPLSVGLSIFEASFKPISEKCVCV